MDELTDRRLCDQEQSLRAVMGAVGNVSNRIAGLGSGAGWLGPASAAYDIAVMALRIEVQAAEVQLRAALNDTINAISEGSRDSCGG